MMTADASATAPAVTATADVDIVLPVYNESKALAASATRLVDYLRDFPFTARVRIVDNASTDDTFRIAQSLAGVHPQITAERLERKGRGYALRHAWGSSDASVMAYMDIDLATDLDALLPLVAPLISGHSDLAIGTRLARGAAVVRGPKREFISRSYNRLLRTFLGVGFSDAQCGFKAVRRDRVRELLPLIEDDEWFFDTELLVLAERAGLRVHEVPVDWVDDPDSRVNIAATARDDILGMLRLGRGLMTGAIPLGRIRSRPTPADRRARLAGQILRFVAVGIVSTLLFSGLFLVFRTMLGPQWSAVAALLLTTVANTAANRRFTFGVHGRRAILTHQLQGLLVLSLALLVTNGSLGALHALTADPSRTAEVLVLTGANLLATAARFVLFRLWVFRTVLPADALHRVGRASAMEGVS